jgi:hypothetical protein
VTLGADVKHVWQAAIDGKPYEVVVMQGQWTGKVRVLVNGSEAAGLRRFDRDRRTRFFVAGRELTLIAHPQGRRVHFDLVLDGRSLRTGMQPRPPADTGESLCVSMLLFFASLAFSLGTLWFAGVSEIRLATEGVKTQGHVTGGRVSSGRSTSYYLEYVFVSQDGGVHSDEGRVHTVTYRGAKLNDPIEIVYVPPDPTIQRPTSFDETWAIAGLVIGFGVCAITTTPSIWRAYQRRRMSQALATRVERARDGRAHQARTERPREDLLQLCRWHGCAAHGTEPDPLSGGGGGVLGRRPGDDRLRRRRRWQQPLAGRIGSAAGRVAGRDLMRGVIALFVAVTLSARSCLAPGASAVDARSRGSRPDVEPRASSSATAG